MDFCVRTLMMGLNCIGIIIMTLGILDIVRESNMVYGEKTLEIEIREYAFWATLSAWLSNCIIPMSLIAISLEGENFSKAIVWMLIIALFSFVLIFIISGWIIKTGLKLNGLFAS